jgi:hypothetical protein
VALGRAPVQIAPPVHRDHRGQGGESLVLGRGDGGCRQQ